jgi:hypothetical protein
MSLGVEGVVDRYVGGEETLGRGLGFEEVSCSNFNMFVGD